jgi:hypothetical protein
MEYKSAFDPLLTNIYNFFENDKKFFSSRDPGGGYGEFFGCQNPVGE